MFNNKCVDYRVHVYGYAWAGKGSETALVAKEINVKKVEQCVSTGSDKFFQKIRSELIEHLEIAADFASK